jgi:hypothetical protein
MLIYSCLNVKMPLSATKQLTRWAAYETAH